MPVIESRGMFFTHYRKPGMLLGDFLFALQGKFLAKSEGLLARPGVREASVHVCEQMGLRAHLCA